MDDKRRSVKKLPTKKRQSRHRKRVIALQAGLVAMLGIVAWRIEYVQHHYGERLLKQASKVQDADHIVLAPRGSLLDSSGNQLAYDVPAFMMDIKTAAFPDKSQLASTLALALHLSAADVLPTLQKSGTWIRWQHPILEPEKEQIFSALKADKHDGDVTFTPTEQRFYPYGSFAANTLGYVADGVGESGLEAQYNSDLSGTNGRVDYTRDAFGFPIPTSVHVTSPVKPGNSVETTVDQTIQGFVEHEMDNINNQYHPERAAIIVTNPKTGAILAMSSRPTFNPNDYGHANSVALSNNFAVNSAFEPGSTFKVIVLAAALATHTITLDQTFESGHIDVAGRQINDWNYNGWGTITFRQALEMSSNVGFATIAMRLGWTNLLHYMQSFGFMHKTGIDLPAEASSIIFPHSEQHKVQLATSGFGQGIAVTPLQQMAAIGAIANGGQLMRPYLAKAIIGPNGKTVKTFLPTVVRQNFLPTDVIAQVNHTMVLDVSEGIDSVGIIKGYDVAGKTGTAQAVDNNGKYYSNRFIVSFIGYAPAEDPQFEVYVTVYWPKTAAGNQWGSTIATPPARNILQDCLQYYHIPPKGDATSLSDATVKNQVESRYVETQNLVGKTKTQAASALKAIGLSPIFIGEGNTVNSQWPPAGIEVSSPSKVYLWLPGGKGNSLIMPDLTGLSMREAGNLLSAVGLDFKPVGTGYVSAQSVAPGQAVAMGSTVTVTCTLPN